MFIAIQIGIYARMKYIHSLLVAKKPFRRGFWDQQAGQKAYEEGPSLSSCSFSCVDAEKQDFVSADKNETHRKR